jgi:hypothetical protein
MFRVFRKLGKADPIQRRRSQALQKSREKKVHPANGIMRLQRSFGNQIVQRLIKSGNIMAKLMIGRQNDPYEREADQVADRVMQMPEQDVKQQAEPKKEGEALPHQFVSSEITPTAQSQEILEDKEFQEKLEPETDEQYRAQKLEEDEEPIQSKESMEGKRKVKPEFTNRLYSLKGGGKPLPESVRAPFEKRFGHDFSGVRTHTGSEASDLARSLNAKAFTSGRDIVFGTGQYSSDSSHGKRLLAHELTHVIQQTRGQINQGRKGERQKISGVTPSVNELIQRQIKDVNQAELASFFSQPEPALPKNILQKYLTAPQLMKIQYKVIRGLVSRVQKRQAPLTANQFLSLVQTMTNNRGTALIVCHNVTKALARGESPIGWKNISRTPLVYSLSGTTIQFDPNKFHREAVAFGTRGKSVFYAIFSADQFGISDEGDWYHYYLTAAATYYAASSKLSYRQPKQGAEDYTSYIGKTVSKVAGIMKDKSIRDSAAYRGWRFANALSFLEGAAYGNKGQKEINNESKIHLQGACAGLAAVRRIPGENWKWYVPKAGGGVKVQTKINTGGDVISKDTVAKTYSGIDGRFRVIIVSATTPDKWYDTPDPYVEYENSIFGRLLAGGGQTSVKDDTTAPVWNEHLTTLDYDALRSVTLKMIDEDSISDDPIVQFRADLRPDGRMSKSFLLRQSGSTLKVKIQAEGSVLLKSD